MLSELRSTIFGLAAIAAIGSASAGSGAIDASAFGGNRTIVFAETFECENGIYGLVVKSEEWSFGISGKGSVLLDTKIVRDAWDLRGVPKHESELYRKYFHVRKITDPEIKEAQAKDAAHKKKVLAALAEEHKRAGLKADLENEQIVYFFSGKARMRVIESLQGDLKTGDEIDVTWKHVQRRISCPPVIPFTGKCGWIFDAKLQNGAQTKLGHGFFSLEEGKKAKSQHEGGEQDNARQPATSVDSNSEGDEKLTPESEGRSQ